MVLYRDMRTYGFREAAYREAREKGVLFVRYERRAAAGSWKLGGHVSQAAGFASRRWGAICEFEPDLVVLAAPMVPRADRQELSELLRVPLNADGFFLEAHMKLRPVDFASEGLVPLRHGPRAEVHHRDDFPGHGRGRPGGVDPLAQSRCPSAARPPGSTRTSASPA